MTIDDQYRRRRERQQSLLAEADERRLAYSEDPRIQNHSSAVARIAIAISRWLAARKTEPAKSTKVERQVRAGVRQKSTLSGHTT